MRHLHLVQPEAQEERGQAKKPGCRIADLKDFVGHPIRGQYRLTGAIEATAATLRLQLTLADVTGTALAFVWPEHRQEVELPPTGCLVEVGAMVRCHEGRAQLCVTSLQPLAPEHIHSVVALLTELRGRAEYEKLRAFEQDLPAPLRQFLQRVLLDPAIGPRLMTCRASRRHHHAEQGGLLAHSLEHLDLIAATVRRTLPGDIGSVAIAQLGYFLHDIGKICTVGSDHRPPLHHVIRHETHNLLLLAEHLTWLRKTHEDLHAGLVYVLEYLSLPAAARPRSRYFPAEVVVQFDQWSAAQFSRRDLSSLVAHPGARSAIRTQPRRTHRHP
jgi:hypothetical protein